MIVVSDTSPITALLKCDGIEILRSLFGEVVIPQAVAKELLRKHPVIPGWFRVVEARDQLGVDARLSRVDLGEAEAIQLAKELRADLLLIDDEDGRSLAAEEGIVFVGLLGVVLMARGRGVIGSARAMVRLLREKGGVYLSERLVETALKSVGE
jgi:predicted nucleic acid-binding protein